LILAPFKGRAASGSVINQRFHYLKKVRFPIRFRQVGSGTEFCCLVPAGCLGSGRADDHWHIGKLGIGSNLAENLKAIHPRQHQIEHEQIESTGAH